MESINSTLGMQNFLENEHASGKNWVVYPVSGSLSIKDLHCFSKQHHAQQYEHDNTSHFDRMIAKPISELLLELRTIKNNNHMENQNLDFLKSNLLNLGFGDKLNESLEKNIKEQKPTFELTHEVPHFNTKMSYTLHFKKSDTLDMYFFNKYDAALKNGKPAEDKKQSFYINKGMGVTAKESFNLLEGRSVFKDLVSREGQKYSAWLKLDFENSDEKGNHKLKQYSDGYGFNLERILNNFPISELQDPEKKAQLLKSLEKGNVQLVTLSQGEKETKYYIEAVPQFKNINVYDQKMHVVRRQSVQNFGLSNTSGQKASEKQEQKKEPDATAVKQRQPRKRKLGVS